MTTSADGMPGPGDGMPGPADGFELRPIEGGYSGETFTAEGIDGPVVVRVYGRAPGRAQVDAALLRLVRGLVPVPGVLDLQPPEGGSPGVLITERVAGERLDLLLPHLDDAGRAAVGRHLGEVVARLSGIPMPAFGGFTDATLVPSRDALLGDLSDALQSLVAWTEHQREYARLGEWPEADYRRLLEVADLADTALAEAEERHVLVHSDLNPKNVLVDPDRLTVTAVLDWEFAHAGSPWTDLGNLTRFDRAPAFVDAVVDRWTELAPDGHAVTDPVRLGRYSDLWALLELAGRTTRNPVTELATTLLTEVARTGDVLAWPFETDHPYVPPT